MGDRGTFSKHGPQIMFIEQVCKNHRDRKWKNISVHEVFTFDKLEDKRDKENPLNKDANTGVNKTGHLDFANPVPSHIFHTNTFCSHLRTNCQELTNCVTNLCLLIHILEAYLLI